jgi:rhamnogalacturonan endolyase
MDLSLRGVSGAGVGVYMAYGNRESSLGGPFFRDIQNQSGTDTEVYNYMNSGHAQTATFIRTGLHGPSALMFTGGTAPAAVPDMSWMGTLGLAGWVLPSGRGKVIGNGLLGRDTNYVYTVGFENTTAQYWTRATASGTFGSYNMKPGPYKMTVYKNELAVYTENVTVNAGAATTLNTRTINADPSAAAAVWRIGNWDGTPNELKNGQTFPIRHPADVRNAAWGPTTYAVGSATNTFPAAQWKTNANSPTRVTFNLSAAQIANRTVRIGITTANNGGRPGIRINNWSAPIPAPSEQADSRSLTIGTYRGNNTMVTYAVPASAFVAGLNTMTIEVVSGQSGDKFLSPGFSYDALDML